jgi:hypothetical protein
MGEGEGADGWGRAVREKGSRERERGEVLTGGAQGSGGGRGARVGPPGPEESGGRASWAEIWPSRGRGEDFSFFLFLFHSFFFSFLLLFLFLLSKFL